MSDLPSPIRIEDIPGISGEPLDSIELEKGSIATVYEIPTFRGAPLRATFLPDGGRSPRNNGYRFGDSVEFSRVKEHMVPGDRKFGMAFMKATLEGQPGVLTTIPSGDFLTDVIATEFTRERGLGGGIRAIIESDNRSVEDRRTPAVQWNNGITIGAFLVAPPDFEITERGLEARELNSHDVVSHGLGALRYTDKLIDTSQQVIDEIGQETPVPHWEYEPTLGDLLAQMHDGLTDNLRETRWNPERVMAHAEDYVFILTNYIPYMNTDPEDRLTSVEYWSRDPEEYAKQCATVEAITRTLKARELAIGAIVDEIRDPLPWLDTPLHAAHHSQLSHSRAA